MSQLVRPGVGAVFYPESDGEPIAENTLQYQWITVIEGGLSARFADNPDVFVAADLFWYPVEGDPSTVVAPDTFVVFGRPKGHRGSYRQWDEGGIGPQVVFEVVSPSNSGPELDRKREFYRVHGVEEYYVYDPDHNLLEGYRRVGTRLLPVAVTGTFVSPLLGTTFDMTGPVLVLRHPGGRPFQTFVEIAAERDALELQVAEREAALAAERQRAAKLAAKLRELGLDPDAL